MYGKQRNRHNHMKSSEFREHHTDINGESVKAGDIENRNCLEIGMLADIIDFRLFFRRHTWSVDEF